MPAQVSRSGLAAQLGDSGRKAWNEHKADEVRYGSGGELPPGIERGVARLVECKFDLYKEGDLKGKYFFYAAGVAVEPAEHDGQRVAGLRTSIMEPMCETPGRSRETIDEHLQWVINELKKLGVATEEMDLDDLEPAAEALKAAGPFFHFRTWQGKPTEQYPNPRTNHDWRGAVPDDYQPAEAEPAVSDHTAAANGAAKSSNGVASKASKPTPGPSGRPAAAKPSPSTSRPAAKPGSAKAAAEPGTGIGDDLDAISDAADDGDESAQAQMMTRAVEAGISEEDATNAESWGALADMIRDISGGESEAEAETEGEGGGDDLEALGSAADEGDQDAADRLSELSEAAGLDPNEYETWAALAEALGGSGASEPSSEWTPEKGEVCYYKPPKAKKAIECEVTAVFESSRKMNLKNLDDGKSVYKSVSWDAIEAF